MEAAKRRAYRSYISTMKKAVAKYGTRAVDGRSKMAYQLRAWRKDVIDTLGGYDNVTPQELAIVEMASMNRMIICSIDAWILSHPTLIRKDQSLMPAILQRQQLGNGLRDDLKAIGLHRRVKQVSLTEILSHDQPEPPKENE